MDDEPDDALTRSLEDTSQAVKTAVYGDQTGHTALLAVAIGLVVAGAQLVVHLFAAVIQLIFTLASRARGVFGRRSRST